MNTTLILGALTAFGVSWGAASAQTLAEVQERGELVCGVSPGMPGFAIADSNGVWQGFDVALCRAVAAAVLGDPMAIRFVPTTEETWIPALVEGEVDVLARNTAWTFSRDVDLPLTFAAVSYYDGQGFMVRREFGAGSALELDGAAICLQPDDSIERNLSEYFRVNNMEYQTVAVQSSAEGQQLYQEGNCDVITAEVSGLAATRASFAEPEYHAILPEVISKEPRGPIVRDGDDAWADLVRWTFYALVAAEEHGVTSANIAELAQGTSNPQVNRLLGSEGEFGNMLGLDAEWAVRAISASGNYGEIFSSMIGEQTPIGLSRGLNALWTQGGLHYTPPFR